MVTLETTLMVVVLVPLLFSIMEFGWLTERWLAQDGVTIHAARLAGEVGGDRPEVREYVQQQLQLVGINGSRSSVEIDPPQVGWREPVRVSIRTNYDVVIPFLFSTQLTVGSVGVARGEVQR